jgi:transposase
MEINLETLPNSPELLQKIILDQQITLQKMGLDLQKKDAELDAYKEYKIRYERLLEQLRLAKQHRFGSSSEKNLSQLGLFDEPGMELSEEAKNDVSDDIEISAHTRKAKPVRKAIPEQYPREVILHDVPDSEKVCECGACLVRIGEEISEQLKYIPEQISVLQHVRLKYACKPCQGNVKIAEMPILLLPKSMATPELVAHTIIAKYCDHIPLYRQEAIWQRNDIAMPRSSLCAWVLKTAELCFPLIEALKKRILAYDYVQVDETRIQVLDEKERENTKKSYMWCYRGGGLDDPSIVFEYQETREGKHAKDFLSGFKGYLQTDAYDGYNWADKDVNITPVGCNAHARRPFAQLVKLSKSKNGLAIEALSFYKKLYAIEEMAREQKLSYDQRKVLREEKSRPVLEKLKEWLDQNVKKTSDQGTIGKAIRYCLNHWSDLTSYLKDGRIEIDNNRVEGTIRPFALGRKNWLFAGSPRGADAGATLYSLIETCKANDIEPYRYFCAMLNKIRFCKFEADYEALLPQNITL